MTDQTSNSIRPAVALVAAVFAFLTACLDREPPQFDDEQQRAEISGDYQSVHDDIEQQRAATNDELVEAHDVVETTGEVGFPEVEIDELLEEIEDEDEE